ncbi:MAG: tail fiber domain-containing protein [Alphaproteobacteria bacterium]|nr:tail fiber domain-containing protein [Alphaproteobacteria bacterium]
MAIKIEFDTSHNVISPTLVLTTRNGEKIGGIIYHNLVVKDAIRNAMDISFSVNKNDYCEKNNNLELWNLLVDFKLIWVKEWDRFFEITVGIDEEESTIKEINAKSLGESELSQINLYNIEINTENDIAREDYEPTVLYKSDNPNASLLHRITEKVPHYTIAHVDSSISNIQRTFTFDDKSIYDAFQEIAEEIECVFEIVCKSDGHRGVQRNVYVYDLDNYGSDTNILLTADVLANNINYSLDTGSVKNCFRLEGGDDLMTATIKNCDPSGSGYIWYISDELKSDMSDELVERLQSYNEFYDYYQNTYDPFTPSTTGLSEIDAQKVSSKITSNATLRTKYNSLVDKYSTYSTNYQKIDSPLVGYPNIMKAYYNTVDFFYYLNNSLMPTATMSDTTAKKEAEKLTFQSLKNTAVQNLSGTTSAATVSSAILAMAKAIVDTRYQTKIIDETASFTYSATGSSTWKGDIKVTNYSDEEDTYAISLRGITISSDYSNFIQQKLKVALANTREDTIASIDKLFELDDSRFKSELKKYSLQRLKAFHDACQSCIDVLIQQGVADNNNTESTLYRTIYLPYYNKLGYIQAEMDIRQSEIYVVTGKYDSDGGLVEEGMQVLLERERDAIQSNLDFQKYLGDSLWKEFVAYRREDTYSNTNYVSDGLDNNELFARAMEFIDTAKEEIEKSATKQHTIDAGLKDLLVMKEFAPLIDSFAVGNWLRIKVDGKIFKLRLVDYRMDFENLENIDITFSDIMLDTNSNDNKDMLSQVSSMATSYNSVSRQARRADKNSAMVENWVDDGLSLTTTKIVDKADNQEVSWDKHGLICREYDALTDSYSDKQIKLINKGVYITDNGWRTAKAGIGNFTFFNPAANDGDGEYQEAYGVIADTIVGNVILGKNVGIYNTKNSITMDENGFTLTTDGTGSDDPQSVFTIRRKTVNNGVKSFKDMFYIDSNGFVTINGGVKIDIDGQSGNSTMVEMVDGKITTHITDELADGGLIESSISQTAGEIRSEASKAMNQWDVENYNVTLFGYDKPWLCGYSAGKNWDVQATYDIELYGYGHPLNDNGYAPVNYANKYYLDRETGIVYYAVNGSVWATTQATSTLISDNRNKYFLNQTTGILYQSDNTQWNYIKQLNLISANLHSEIVQTAESITSTVSATYETKTDSNNKKTVLESSINQTASNIESTVKATSGWDIASLNYTINIIGTIDRGNDHSAIGDYIAGEHIGEFYLDDLTGHVYESKLESGSTTEYAWWWKANLTRADSSIYSRIDQTANSITSTVSATYETKDDASDKKEALESTISQTANQIKLNVSSSLSQYDLSSFNGVISVFGYGAPTASKPSAATYKNQYYLNQSNGQIYKSNGSSWSTYGSPLSVISDSWQSQITQNAGSISAVVTNLNNNYYKKSELQITENGVTSSVTDYLSGTFIRQRANDIQIAWNKISKYISFENAALNIYDSTSQGVSHLLMRLNSSGLNYYDYDASATYSLQVLGTPASTTYEASDYAGKYYQNLSNNDVYLSDGVNWRKVDALGSRFNMRTDRNGAFYYYEGLQLGKIGTNTMGTDHANHSVRGLVFDLEPYAQYMTWAARDDVSDGYGIKFTYFREGVTFTSGSSYSRGFYFDDDVYFRDNVQMNGNTLYLNSASSSYIGFNSGGALQIVGTSDKALILTGYGSKSISIGGSGVSINTDVTVTGTVTSGSDARLKTNIVDSRTNALSLLSDIELKEFDWLSDGSHTSVGIIAQQLKEVIPELVHENPETGMLSIKVDRFIPFLVKSIQELYVLCGGKKQKNKNGWTDILSDKDKRAFASSILNNKPQQPVKPPKTKEEIILLNK